MVTPDQLVRQFLSSPEYVTQFGSISDADFVQLAYRYGLLREVTQADLDHEVSQLTSSPESRVSFVERLLTSPEFQSANGVRMTAVLLYNCLLQRDPTKAEIERLTKTLQVSTSQEDAIEELISMPEFSYQVN